MFFKSEYFDICVQLFTCLCAKGRVLFCCNRFQLCDLAASAVSHIEALYAPLSLTPEIRKLRALTNSIKSASDVRQFMILRYN